MGLVFANTKKVVDDVVDGLTARGYPVDRLHGDMPQMMRERVMDSFRKGSLRSSGWRRILPLAAWMWTMWMPW